MKKFKKINSIYDITHEINKIVLNYLINIVNI